MEKREKEEDTPVSAAVHSVDDMRNSNPAYFTHVLSKARTVGIHPQFGYEAVCGGYLLQQNPQELAALVAYLKQRPNGLGTYVEIGTASGGTLRFLYEELKAERLLSIDNGEHEHAGYQRENLAGILLTRFVGDSHGQEAREALKAWASGEAVVDVAFIDGDHSREGLLQDFHLVRPYLTPNAIVILHDTTAVPAVADALRQLLQERRVTVIANFVAPDNAPPAFGITVCEVLP